MLSQNGLHCFLHAVMKRQTFAGCCIYGYQRILVHTDDTDAVVLTVMVIQALLAHTTVWLAFRARKSLAAYRMSSCLEPEKSLALPMFHTLTGCGVAFLEGRLHGPPGIAGAHTCLADTSACTHWNPKYASYREICHSNYSLAQASRVM